MRARSAIQLSTGKGSKLKTKGGGKSKRCRGAPPARGPGGGISVSFRTRLASAPCKAGELGMGTSEFHRLLAPRTMSIEQRSGDGRLCDTSEQEAMCCVVFVRAQQVSIPFLGLICAEIVLATSLGETDSSIGTGTLIPYSPPSRASSRQTKDPDDQDGVIEPDDG